jgi:NAD(P)-dependent dehydrogenase (short-subunit alcohol dehydrogenase family)
LIIAISLHLRRRLNMVAASASACKRRGVPMAQFRYDSRVAVITGAGRGLGRAYAELLASRGAKVVVNDIGGNLKGEGADTGPAEEAVRAIKALGGEAIASTDSVATPAGGKAIIEAAMDTYGRIDILIHNAGNVRRGSLKDMPQEDFDLSIDVHFRGAFHVARPAFPLMCKAGYGRMVMTSSDVGLYGTPNTVNYAMSKAGMIGLVNVIALEGAAEGVKANAIVPAAVTRMAEGVDTSKFPPMTTDMVAPAVAWLCHERCDVTAQYIVAGAGRVARAYIAETRGAYSASWTVEEIARNAEAIQRVDPLVTFAPAPNGHFEHLRYGMAMQKKGSA